MAFERIIAVLINIETPAESIFGNIHTYIQWNFSYNQYLSNTLTIPVFKVWTGR
jgi:hypothetical protein